MRVTLKVVEEIEVEGPAARMIGLSLLQWLERNDWVIVPKRDAPKTNDWPENETLIDSWVRGYGDEDS